MATTPTKKTPAPKLTAADRRLKREQEATADEQRRAAARAEFEIKRPGLFAGLFARAVRLELMIRTHDDLDHDFRDRTNASWWFEDFHVDAWKQTFSVNELGGRPMNEASLHPADVDRIDSDLNLGYSLLQEHLGAIEKKRKEEIEKEQRRQAALSKLTPEDKKLLGLH